MILKCLSRKRDLHDIDDPASQSLWNGKTKLGKASWKNIPRTHSPPIDARVFFWQESFFKQSMLYLHRKNRQPWFHLGFVEVSRNCLSGGDYGVSGIPEVSLSFEIPPAIPTFDPFRREILRQYCIKNWSCNYNCCHVCVLKPSSNHSNGYGPKVNIKIAGKWMFIPQKWYKEWQYIVIYRYIVCDSVCVLYIYIYV